MRALVLVAVLALALALPGASARPVTFELEARDDAFYLKDGTEPNPPLEVEAGDEVTVVFFNRALAAHNVHFGAPLNVSTPCCQVRGDLVELRFVAPNVTGGVPYWSDADAQGYRGVLLVGEALPRVRIVAPEEGADVGGTLDVRIVVENFVLEPFPAGSDPVAGRGHARYLLDGQGASLLTDRTAHRFENVPPGHHIVRVELVGRDGAPLDPPVADEVLVYRVVDATPPPTDADPPPMETPTKDAPWPGVLAALAALAIAARSRRPRR